MLRSLVEQRPAPAPRVRRTNASKAFDYAVQSFTSFMLSDTAAATRFARDATRVGSGNETDDLLAWACLALAASADADLDDEQASARMLERVARVDPADPTAAFARHVACEAALASARLDLAAALASVRPAPQEVWSNHPYARVMLACEARIAAFTGNITQALELLSNAGGDGVTGALLRATRALAAGNAADIALMRTLVAEVDAADVAPVDRLGRGVHLLLAFSEIALGDVNGAVRHLLNAGGGAELEHLTIIDRSLGHELLIAQAVSERDLESALAWQQLAEKQAHHRVAAPVVLRCRARVALLAGDPAAAEAAAAEAVETSTRDGRGVEAAEGEMVLAQARIAARRVPEATRSLRVAVASGDSTGHHAVRRSATQVLRPARRRLPPISGGGWESLSARERDIAGLIIAGQSNDQIAAGLHLSVTTVRTHVTRILTAYRVATRTGLLAKLHQLPEQPQRPVDLTPRQGDVAALIASGRGNTEIAAALGISIKSVETHISAIRDRWQVSSRFDVASQWWDLQQQPR